MTGTRQQWRGRDGNETTMEGQGRERDNNGGNEQEQGENIKTQWNRDGDGTKGDGMGTGGNIYPIETSSMNRTVDLGQFGQETRH